MLFPGNPNSRMCETGCWEVKWDEVFGAEAEVQKKE